MQSLMTSFVQKHDSNRLAFSRIVLVFLSLLLYINYFFSNDYLALVVSLSCSVYLLIVDEQDLVPSMLYLTFFSYLFRYDTYSLYFIVCFSALIRVFFIAGTERFGLLFFSSLYIVLHLITTNITSISFGDITPFFSNVLLLAFCINKKIILTNRCNYFFLAGFLLSSILALFKSYTRLPSILADSSVYYEKFELFSRFSGLTYDANFYTMLTITLLIVLIKMPGAFYFKTAVFLVALFFGFATYSKSFYLSLVFCLVYLFKNVKDVNMISVLKYCFIFFIIGLCCYGAAESFFQVVLFRIFNSNSLDELTTGRSHLWTMYIDEICSDGFSFMFGHGMIHVIRKAAHNTYVEILYYFGLFGGIVDLIYVFYCAKRLDVRVSFFDTIPYLALFFILFNLSAFSFTSLWACAFILFANMSTYQNGARCLCQKSV